MKRLTLIMVVALLMVSIGRAEDPPYATTSIISFEMTVNDEPAILDRPFEGAGSYTLNNTIPFEAKIVLTCQVQPSAAMIDKPYNRAKAFSSLKMPWSSTVPKEWSDVSQGEDLASIPIAGTNPTMKLTLTTYAPADNFGIELPYSNQQVVSSGAWAQWSGDGDDPWTNEAEIGKLVKLTFTVSYAPQDTKIGRAHV